MNQNILNRIDVVGTCASEVLTPAYSYPIALKNTLIIFVASYTLPLFIAASIVPNRKDWNIKTYFYVAKVVGGKLLEVSNNPTINNGVILNMYKSISFSTIHTYIHTKNNNYMYINNITNMPFLKFYEIGHWFFE